MNGLMKFSYKGYDLQATRIKGKYFFNAIQAAEILGYKHPIMAILKHCSFTPGIHFPPNSKLILIDTCNLLLLVKHSKLEEPNEFTHWVFLQVMGKVTDAISSTLDPPIEMEVIASLKERRLEAFEGDWVCLIEIHDAFHKPFWKMN